jgi:hypothetical protein
VVVKLAGHRLWLGVGRGDHGRYTETVNVVAARHVARAARSDGCSPANASIATPMKKSCSASSMVGLLAEEYDVGHRRQVGNFPAGL